MDLMTLAAKITLDDSSYKSGIQNAESMGERLAGKMSAMTVAVGNLVADVVRKAVSGIQNVIGGAIDGYADYQQLIGGVETLFKGSADKVAAYAKQSFKNTGLSANDYMETVTSFSASLLQGLKGDTDSAAELANTAIQDMADNANKMGTDISAIQTAYQGFAKQNYTMLDNLKLGYGGTKEEMVRLVNDSGILEKKIDSLDGITFDQLIQAIHKIQEEMGITGTTAQEAAGTISGSKASLAAAWEDLLTAVAGDGKDGLSLDESLENFKTSFSTYMDNYIPALEQTILNVGVLVQGVADAVSHLPESMISNLLGAGLEAGTGIIGGAEEIVNWLIDSITASLKDLSIDPRRVVAFGEALGHFVGSTVGNLITNLPTIVTGLFEVGVNLAGSIIAGIWDGLFGNGSEVDQIREGLTNKLIDVETQTTKAGALLDYMDTLIEKYGTAAKDTEEWKAAQEELNGILGGSTEVFESYGSDIGGAVEQLKAMNEELRRTAIINALEKASADEMELLATQTLTYNKAKGSYSANEAIQKSIIDELITTIQSTAKEKAAEINEQGGPIGAGQTDYYNKLVSLSEGMSHVGDRMTELAELDFSGLTDALNFLDSEAYSTEQLEGKRIAYEQAGVEMDAAKATMDATQKELEATKEAIAQTDAAMAQTVKDLMGSGTEAANSVKTGGSVLYSSLVSVAGAISKIQIPTIFGGGGNNKNTVSYMPRAVGLDYAPEGLRAELHQGEAILTKEDNQRRMNNGYGGIDDMELALEDAIERSMSRMYINMNGERVADITTKRTGKNISGTEHSRMRAIGG